MTDILLVLILAGVATIILYLVRIHFALLQRPVPRFAIGKVISLLLILTAIMATVKLAIMGMLW